MTETHQARQGDAPPGKARGLASIPSLTVSRGLLAVWVVLHHYWADIKILLPASQLFDPFIERGNLAVLGFFVLSGCVISYNYASWFPSWPISPSMYTRFMLQRLARIYPVHLATLLAVLVLVLFSRRAGVPMGDGRYSGIDFVWNLLMVHAWSPKQTMTWNFPSWSISAEWLVYLAFPFFAVLFHRWIRNSTQALVVGIFLLMATCIHMQFWAFSDFQAIKLVVPNFLIGMAIHHIGTRGALSRIPRILPDLLVVAVALSCFVPDLRISTFLLMVIPTGMILVLFRIGDSTTRFWRLAPLVYLGEISYSLYLTHAVVEKPLHKLVPVTAWAGRGMVRALEGLAIYVGVVGVAAWICYVVVERPLRIKLGGWLKRRAAPKPAI